MQLGGGVVDPTPYVAFVRRGRSGRDVDRVVRMSACPVCEKNLSAGVRASEVARRRTFGCVVAGPAIAPPENAPIASKKPHGCVRAVGCTRTAVGGGVRCRGEARSCWCTALCGRRLLICRVVSSASGPPDPGVAVGWRRQRTIVSRPSVPLTSAGAMPRLRCRGCSCSVSPAGRGRRRARTQTSGCPVRHRRSSSRDAQVRFR